MVDISEVQFFIGWDPRETTAWNVCVKSLLAHASIPPSISPISITHLGRLYLRPTSRKNGRLWDELSQAYCSTEFSLARFYAPLVSTSRWAIFMDGDFLIRADVKDLLSHLNDKYAVQVVKHEAEALTGIKMDGQEQSHYPRKWWSSLIAFNKGHAGIGWRQGNINTMKGLELHQFAWLKDEEIGDLPQEWNHLVSVNTPNPEAKGVHLTMGTPDMAGWSGQEFEKEWWSYT